MSKISLSGNPSGTGTFTIASPNSNTNRTLNLPDAAGTIALTSDIPTGGANVQTFNSNGTWTKPATGSMARIQVWGGGGGAGRGNAANRNGGGGGGAYNEITVPLSTLGATVAVTVGAGGAGRTGSTGVGSFGGTSSFGTVLTGVNGGSGGTGDTSNFTAGAFGGAPTSSSGQEIRLRLDPGNSLSTLEGSSGRPESDLGASFPVFPVDGFFVGGGVPGQGNSPASTSANSIWGGGGGAKGNAFQGFSLYGGDGGAPNSNGVAPGGGGGGNSAANGNGFAGGAGRVIVTVW